MNKNINGRLLLLLLFFPIILSLPLRADYAKVNINGGEMHHIAIAPGNPRRVYAASGNVNLWLSDDWGETWSETNLRQQVNGGAEQIVVDPANENVILANVSSSGNLYWSEDSGNTWISIDFVYNYEIGLMDMAFCPAHPGVVYFAGNNMTASPATTGEIWKSEDSGKNWEKTDFDSGGNPLTSMAVDINGVIYVGYKVGDMEKYTCMDGDSAGGIRVSTDSGETWSELSYPEHTRGFGTDFYPLNIHASSTTVAFAGGGNIWVSTGPGAEFAHIFDDDIEQSLGMEWRSLMAFAISPDGRKIFYPFLHDGPDIFVAEYNGTWSTGTKRSRGGAENDLDSEKVAIFGADIYIDPDDPNIMYLTETLEYGVFKTIDGGVNWNISNEGINALIVESGVKCPLEGNIYILGPSSVYRSEDDGESWERVYGYGHEHMDDDSPVGFMRGKIEVNADGVIVAAGEGKIVRSADGGNENSWAGAQDVSFTPGGIVFNPEDPDIGYAVFYVNGSTQATTENYLYKTTDAGANWTAVEAFSTMSVHSIAISPADPSILYLGIGENKGWIEDKEILSIPGGMVKITDTELDEANPELEIETIGLEDTIPYRIAVDTVNPNIIYAACIEDMTSPVYDGPLYVSRNGGEEWTRMYDDEIYTRSGGMSDIKFSYPGIIYSCSEGVFTVMNVGLSSETHKMIIPGEEVGVVRSLTIGSLYAGASTGLWRFIGDLYDIISDPDPDTTDEEDEDVDERVLIEPLSPNEGTIQVQGGAGGYVNPDRGESARIYFKPSRAGRVTVSVYTARGQLVWEDSKRVSGDGADHFEWACRNAQNNIVASGIYIVHVKGPGLDKRERIAIVK